MKTRQMFAMSALAVFIFWASALAQRAPTNTAHISVVPGNENAASPVPGNAKKTKTKEKRWTGNLVDATCMARALGAGGAGDLGGPEAAPPGASQLTDSTSAPVNQVGPGGAAQAQQNPQPGGQAPSTGPAYPAGGPMPAPQPTPEQQRREAMSRAVDHAAKTCAATPSTERFALAMPNGKVVKFGQEGNTKASKALKALELKPGKRVKAKVTVAMEGSTVGKVISVKVKGKRTASSSGN